MNSAFTWFAVGGILSLSTTALGQKEEIWNWERVASKIGSLKAPDKFAPKGTLIDTLSNNPKSINPLVGSDNNSTLTYSHFFMTLFTESAETLTPVPLLAESATVSADNKVITFNLNPEAKWADGTQVTSDDVEFSFKTMMDPKTDAAASRSYHEGHSFKKINKLTFQFHVAEPKFDSFRTLYLFQPVQKKQFANTKDFNKDSGILNPVGNGPWKLSEFKADIHVKLTRVENWWGDQLPYYKNKISYQTKLLKIIPDPNTAYEQWIRGDIHFYGAINAQQFADKVLGSDKDRVGQSASEGKEVWAKFFENEAPRGYQYIGWNLRNPMFQSKKTRQALARLINYQEISDKVFRGLYIQCTSPFGSLSLNAAPELRKEKMLTYNFREAMKMLREDGWSDTDKNNVLDKMFDGKKVQFEFTLKTNQNNPLRVQMAQIIQQDLRKAGVKLNISSMEWNAFLSDVDSRNFEALILGWTATPYPNANQTWHTDSEKNQGSNFVAYSNPKVDELIAKSNVTFDPAERSQIMQDINRMIYEDQPYAFLLEPKGVAEGYNKRLFTTGSYVERYATGSDMDRYFLSE